MITQKTLQDLSTNVNTGVEFEIALFYCLSSEEDKNKIECAIAQRTDIDKIHKIISDTDVSLILDELNKLKCRLLDVCFETQNDEVGPADLVMSVCNNEAEKKQIGLSIKYANTCTLNVTGRKFITDAQISSLKDKYVKHYFPRYRDYMIQKYGNASNWHRKTSPVTDEFIDEIRDAVIENWHNVPDKVSLLNNMFHADSPIEFWVVTYLRNGIDVKTVPPSIDESRANDVTVAKYQTSYVAFYLGERMIGKMQVKFNNGFIESRFDHKGKPKRKSDPDFKQDGLEFLYGAPFGSWNFSVEK